MAELLQMRPVDPDGPLSGPQLSQDGELACNTSPLEEDDKIEGDNKSNKSNSVEHAQCTPSDIQDDLSVNLPPDGSMGEGVVVRGEDGKDGTLGVNKDKCLAWPSMVNVMTDKSPHQEEDFIQEATKLYKKRFLYKNLVVLSCCFLLTYTALGSVNDLRNLAQNFNSHLSIMEYPIYHSVVIVTLFFLAPWVVIKLGNKTAMILGLVTCVFFALSTAYVHVGTVVTSRILMGLGVSLLWTAHGGYIIDLSSLISDISGVTPHDYIYPLFGCFYCILHVAEVFSSLLSGYILYGDQTTDTVLSRSYSPCGALYCPIRGTNATWRQTTNIEQTQVYTLVGADVLLCSLSVLAMVLCLSELKCTAQAPELQPQTQPTMVGDFVVGEPSQRKTDCSEWLWLAGFRQLTSRRQMCLIPVTVYSGLQHAFYVWYYTQSYIVCISGYWVVAMTTVCCGAVTSVLSLFSGFIVGRVGRIPLFVVAALSHCVWFLSLFLWQPKAGQSTILFILSGLWGIGNAIWQSQLHGLYAVLFADTDREASLAHYQLWRVVGILTVVVSSNYLCTSSVVFVSLSVLTLGMLGYFCVEVPIYRRQHTPGNINDSD